MAKNDILAIYKYLRALWSLTSTDPGFILVDISKYHEERREGTGPVTVRQPASQGAKASPKGTMRPTMANAIGPPFGRFFCFRERSPPEA